MRDDLWEIISDLRALIDTPQFAELIRDLRELIQKYRTDNGIA